MLLYGGVDQTACEIRVSSLLITFSGMALGGIVAGFFGSLLGLGGGIFIIPMLNLIFGVEMRSAVAASLVAVIATSSAAASVYVQERLSDIRLGMTLELATTLGAIVGGLLAGRLPREALTVLFGLLLLYTAGSMVRNTPAQGNNGSPFRDNSKEKVMPEYQVRNLPVGLGASFFAGNISGLLGVGGGIIKVPVMYLSMGVPLKVATATSNFMIGVTAAASAFIYYSRGDLDLLVAGPVVLGVFLGARTGSRIMHQVRTAYLKWFFVAVLFYTAMQMLLKGFDLHVLWF